MYCIVLDIFVDIYHNSENIVFVIKQNYVFLFQNLLLCMIKNLSRCRGISLISNYISLCLYIIMLAVKEKTSPKGYITFEEAHKILPKF